MASPVGNNSRVQQTAELALVALVFSASFFFTEITYQTSNYTSRLLLTQAMVDHGTFSLNVFQDQLGVDHAVYEGNYFSDKPPGSSLLMLPAYLLVAKPLKFVSQTAFGLTLSQDTCGWIVHIGSLSTLVSLGMLALYRILGCLQISRRFPLTLLSFFGTLMFPYSTTGMGEMYTVPLLLWGTYWFLIGVQAEDKKALGYSGLLLGLMVLTTYQTVLFAGLLGTFLLFRVGFWTTLLHFAPALLIAGLLAMGYHWLLFDNPFTPPATYWAPGNPPTMEYEWPTAGKLLEMLCLPWKGIFFYSPFLLLSVPGYLRMTRQPLRWLAILLILCFASYFLFFAFNAGWYGGSEYGFRYIVPALPFLCIGAAVWLDGCKMGVLEWSLVLLSLLVCGLGAITDPHVPREIGSPITEYAFPFLRIIGTNNLLNQLLLDRGIMIWWLRVLTTLLFVAGWLGCYHWCSRKGLTATAE